jgi:membrane protein implicated in regulation of membrane protease activity
MTLIAIAWIYVVLMMAAAEATSPNGSVAGAVFTFLGYGVLPLGIVLYIGGSPARRRRRRSQEAREREAHARADGSPDSIAQPDGGGHAAGDTVAPERKEP